MEGTCWSGEKSGDGDPITAGFHGLGLKGPGEERGGDKGQYLDWARGLGPNRPGENQGESSPPEERRSGSVESGDSSGTAGVRRGLKGGDKSSLSSQLDLGGDRHDPGFRGLGMWALVCVSGMWGTVGGSSSPTLPSTES